MKVNLGAFWGKYRPLILAALIGYVTLEVGTLGVFAAPVMPISYLVIDTLGWGLRGAIIVLTSLMGGMLAGVGLVVSAAPPAPPAPPVREEPVAPPAEEEEKVKGLDRSYLNKILDYSARNFVEVFPLRTGAINIYGAVSKEEGTEGYRYVVIEPELSEKEKKSFAQLKELLIEEMNVDLRSIETPQKAEAFLSSKVAQLAKKYGLGIPRPTMRKLQYYFARDFIHLGKVEPLMLDPLIEDVSCDGPKIPIYVWHRDYESIPTNLVFNEEEELDSFVSKLAYVSGKHISLAVPLVDASLQDGSRLHLTYGKEVTQRGSTFTIRKFKADPLTIVDLIKYNTINAEVAAYLGYLVEKRFALLVAGATASGKSVTGDTEVLVYREGKSELVRIAELYDEAAAAGPVKRDGVYDVASPGGWRTAAFGRDLKAGIFEVKSVIRHRAPETVFVLRTRSGREVRVTGDHSVFGMSGGRVAPFRVSDLGPGAYVAVPRSIPSPAPPEEVVDLVESLSEDDRGLYIENVAPICRLAAEKIGVSGVAAALGLRQWEVKKGIRRGFLAVRVARLAALAKKAGIRVDPSILRVRPKTTRRHSIPASLRVGPHLMRLLGYWVSEGMYQNHGLSLFQRGEEVREDMALCARGAFGIDLKPSRGGDRTRLDLSSTAVKAVFQEVLGLQGGSGSKSIPALAMRQGQGLLSEFLRAYFTGDGWARTYVEASTKSRRLAGELQYALARFGIVAAVRPKSVKGSTYYSVLLYGQANMRRFAETIGFTAREKQTTLVDQATKPRSAHTNVDTIPATSELFREVEMALPDGEKGRLRHQYYDYLFRGRAMGRQTMLEYAGKAGVDGRLKERLVDLATSDIFWDEVTEVEEVPCRDEYVYDLEVPGPQNFVGGMGGVFLHNTTSLNCLSMFIVPGQKIVSVEDSVTGDSEILVSDSGGVHRVKIGPYVDSALSRESMRTEMGHEVARPGDVSVLTANRSGRVLWSPCTALIRHKVRKEFVKVSTRSGKSIEVTSDHSLFTVGERGEVTELSGRDIGVGTFVLAPRLIPIAGRKTTFDLEKMKEFSDYWFKDAPVANGGGGTVQQLRVHALHSPLSIPARVPLNADLAFLAGLWVADGFYGERSVGFSAGGKGVESRIRAIAGSLGVNVTHHSDGISLLINSKPFMTLFAEVLGLKGDDYTRRVPDVFFGATDDVAASFLRGYFTGDASVDKNEIYAESASRELLLDLQTLLLRFGIVFKVGTKRKVGTLGGVGTYRGSITGSSQVMAFAEQIGFEQEGKMRGIVPGVYASKYYVDPVPLNGRLLEEMRGVKKEDLPPKLWDRVRKGVERGVVLRRTLLELGERNPGFRGTRAYALAASDLHFDEVVSIERSSREEYVYDLSVPETGMFIANNLVCHNTPELSLPHENWIQEVTRAEGTANEISLFDLVRNSLRQRPDIIIVGEIRGKEAFSLFQAISTGHGGFSTIHADSVEAVFNRLTTEPMSIPRSLVGTSLDCIVLQLKLRIGDRSVRRVVSVSEILGYDNRTNEMVMNEVYKWDPVTDRLVASGRSRLVDKINQRYGIKPEEVRRDLESRKVFLEWLASKNYRSYGEVSTHIQEFYANPYAMASRARTELEALQ